MSFKFWILYILALPMIALAATPTMEELTKRIEQLERQQDDLLFINSESREAKVSSFLNDRLTFGGFFEPGYTIIQGPDTETQMLNSTNLLGFNLAAEYNDRMKFVAQTITALGVPLANEHNHPDAAGGQPEQRAYTNYIFATLLTQGYLQYSFNDKYKLMGGLGYAPFGYAIQQLEPVLFVRRNGPQLLRTTDLVSLLWSGFNFQARLPLQQNYWGYNFYTFSPPNSVSHPGLGARTFWASRDDSLTLGLSTQLGKLGAQSFKTVGADFRYNAAPWLLTTEFAHGFFENDENPWNAYVEPGLYIYDDRLLLFAFGDYSYNVRNRNGGTSATSFGDPIQKWEYGTGVNWLPTSYTRLRLTFTWHDYVGDDAVIRMQERDYQSVDISAGVAF